MYLSSGKPGRGLVRKLGSTMPYSTISWGREEPGLGSERWSAKPASTRLRIVKDVSQALQGMEYGFI